MRLNQIKPNKGAKHRRKRLGCGESSGQGKTCGKGHKGQKSRSGGGVRPGFEGGQMPLYRRLPTRGFNNHRFADKVVVVNVAQLEAKFDDGAEVSVAALRELGLVKGAFDAVKILGQGDLNKKLSLSGVRCSASAKEKIEKAGGSVA